MKADKTLDCFGLLCPVPIIKTSKELKNMKVGQVLEVQATDAGIKRDMESWCKLTGNQLLRVDKKNGEFRVYVKKAKN